MGRHSRKGRGDKGGTGSVPVIPEPARGRAQTPVQAPGADGAQASVAAGAQASVQRQPAGGAAQRPVPRFADGTPANGVPRFAEGTPARGVPAGPRLPDGTPARGVPRFLDGTPAHGTPRPFDGTPAHGTPQVRGGHPQQREPGGGWGESGGVPAGAPKAAPPGPRLPGQRRHRGLGPRQDYVDAFGADEDDVFAPRGGAGNRMDPYGPPSPHAPHAHAHAPATDRDGRTGADTEAAADEEPGKEKGGKGRTFTGIAAAAVTTVLAVVVAGQVADGHDDKAAVQSQSATDSARDARDSASRGDDRPTPSGSPSVAALTYGQKMAKVYPLGATLKAAGKFDAIGGFDKAPGGGRKYTYRVDVEKRLGLDGELFAQAVQKTLNDDRSWAHNGARTFERISSGKPDFVITLASPGTTADWCAKSGLDTTEDNVSCDSAATERVMINAYRWAQGSKTYGFGDQIHAYRQMLINHEIGHRLGYGHVTCGKDGELAPVMQQQTKFLDHDGIHCRANAWPYPGS
ncbi:hypothetical protein AQJ43_01480 [Streptomyces avermitilis]|uniref:DUF3152 domain-containing protein n=2 Tax=Streptomyces avermitilis TaxID=33903 RepID=Q82IP2_STRAW|nr:hypothetical protein AQJ43_01480 [Streptomyces avermitilis]OOV32963.1 hypothetical protein SM007_09320 [Streptomyces avermitilis]BAC70802.1 hypothetical protein SAVERM_3091 [Streptomyces avermitilis MA-4680 = NBRC 14893]GDY62974.1 hypothetical protein SAV14893_023670 [Streptomyces avermitilis]GDY85816.1 hypothetical protein SAVCW2_50150 [Streptomyces avermitilis]